jgi:hypothetical protein
MIEISVYDLKRYFNNLTEQGKQQVVIILFSGNKEDKKFLIDQIIFFKQHYPVMKKVVVNGR